MKPSALIPLLTLVSSHGTSAQSADWQSVTWREPQVRYLIADLFLGGTSVCTPSAWSPDGKWISFRRTDERYWSNKERMLKIYSEKPADKRPVWVIRPDGTEATLIEPLRFQMAIDGSRASWKPASR